MSCDCGDTYCQSCGPAQGNYRCEICGKWSDEGGCDDPNACEEKGHLANEAYAEELAEEARLAELYWAEEERLQKEYREKQSHCPHGQQHHECNDCMIASDLAYDASREKR